ncbi:MAG: PHP domain-containing protein [bacterium]
MKRVSPAPHTADLHAHSTCSDGALSPTALVELAARRGVRHLALTDHDTIEGIAEARNAGNRRGVQIIAALELSVWQERELHVLGYFVDPDHPGLRVHLQDYRTARTRRIHDICDRLAELGVVLDPAAILASAAGNPGRPHIAHHLVKGGHVRTFDEAFQRYLGNGRPACVPSARLSAADGIAALHAAGGVAVLAHPAVEGAEAHLAELVDLGLDGLECSHPAHDAATTRRLRLVADALGLVATGGSDFHRAEGGSAPGSHGVEPVVLARLHERRRAA